MATRRPNSTKAHCNECGGSRDHAVLKTERTDWHDDEHPIWGGRQYDMLRCRGCGEVKLRRAEWFSENTDERGRMVPEVSYYPPAAFRREPRWLRELWLHVAAGDDELRQLLREIYVALQNDQRRLAAMGVRALLESIMVSQVGDEGNFVTNLAAFEREAHVSRIQRERLETILEVGHAAMHRRYAPSARDLVTLIDIAESIIESVYVHEGRVRELKGRIPPRRKKQK